MMRSVKMNGVGHLQILMLKKFMVQVHQQVHNSQPMQLKKMIALIPTVRMRGCLLPHKI